MQSRNRIMSGICSSRRATEVRTTAGLYPRGLKTTAGHGMAVFSRKMWITVSGYTSYGDTAIRCPASSVYQIYSSEIASFQKL